MKRVKKSDDYTERIKSKHDVVYQRYLELMRQEISDNPIRAQYIVKTYYTQLLAQDPVIGMTHDYIRKIVNNRVKNDE